MRYLVGTDGGGTTRHRAAAIEAAATIEDEFGYELSIEDIFTSGVADLSTPVWNGLRAGS
jgi:hypothetical protein